MHVKTYIYKQPTSKYLLGGSSIPYSKSKEVEKPKNEVK